MAKVQLSVALLAVLLPLACFGLTITDLNIDGTPTQVTFSVDPTRTDGIRYFRVWVPFTASDFSLLIDVENINMSSLYIAGKEGAFPCDYYTTQDLNTDTYYICDESSGDTVYSSGSYVMDFFTGDNYYWSYANRFIVNGYMYFAAIRDNYDGFEGEASFNLSISLSNCTNNQITAGGSCSDYTEIAFPTTTGEFTVYTNSWLNVPGYEKFFHISDLPNNVAQIHITAVSTSSYSILDAFPFHSAYDDYWWTECCGVDLMNGEYQLDLIAYMPPHGDFFFTWYQDNAFDNLTITVTAWVCNDTDHTGVECYYPQYEIDPTAGSTTLELPFDGPHLLDGWSMVYFYHDFSANADGYLNFTFWMNETGYVYVRGDSYLRGDDEYYWGYEDGSEYEYISSDTPVHVYFTPEDSAPGGRIYISVEYYGGASLTFGSSGSPTTGLTTGPMTTGPATTGSATTGSSSGGDTGDDDDSSSSATLPAALLALLALLVTMLF